jgi:hypothetical protein
VGHVKNINGTISTGAPLKLRITRWPAAWSSDTSVRVKTTRYFEEQVLSKRPYIQRHWCQAVLAAPIRKMVQDDGRLRFWGKIMSFGDDSPRFLRVVTLEDGETVHNAFFDRGFREEGP